MGEIAKRALTGRVTLQPAGESGRREYKCVFMTPGRVMRADGELSTWLIPATVIEEAALLFDGVASYLDHPQMFGFGWHQDPQVRDLVGVTFDAHWDAERRELTGNIRLYDEGEGSAGAVVGALMDQMLADKEAGEKIPPVGLSAVMYCTTRLDEDTGLTVTDHIRFIESIDFVYSPGAGGYVRAALAKIGHGQAVSVTGANSPRGGTMFENTSAPPVVAGDPPQEDRVGLEQVLVAIEEMSVRLAPVVEPEPDSMQTQLDALARAVEVLGRAAEDRTVQGMGEPPRSGVRGMLSGMDQVDQAVDAMFAGVRPPDGIRPLTGIRELYTLLSGDYEMAGMFHSDRVYLANVNSSTMAGLVANRLNKRVINLFAEYPKWWERAVTIEDFSTLQDVRWITLGGVGELPTVSEGAAYTELTWDDQTETDAFIKKGGYLGLTLEAIDKDDTQKIRAAPRALAQAAWLTLSKSISAIFTDATGTGPTMSDSNVLFDATNHGNLLTTALSYSEWEVVKIAMMKQTELNSSERLGALTRPYFLWVPIDLETLAIQILASEGEPGTADNDINVNASGESRGLRLSLAQQRVIVCPLWTEVDHWAAQADPRMYPSIGLGFRYGRTPEIFSVADQNAGLMFANDVLPVKVRFFFAVGPTDWRGLHKSNV